jgi:hypothetical protein
MQKTNFLLATVAVAASVIMACQNNTPSQAPADTGGMSVPDKGSLIYDLPFDQQDYRLHNRYYLQALGDLAPVAVSADSELSVFVKERAIDRNLGTQWASGVYRGRTAWLTMDLGVRQAISNVALKTGPTAPGCSYDIEVSDTGTTFTPVMRNVTNTTWNLEIKTLPSVTNARYVRIFWRNNPTAPANRFAIYELLLRGEQAASATPGTTPSPSTSAQPSPRASASASVTPVPSPSASSLASQYYPNLQARPATSLWLQQLNGQRSVRFANTIPNQGGGHFQVRGDNSSGTTTQAYQEIINDVGRVFETRFVGAFEYHPTHNHMHLDSVARYQLRAESPTGPLLAESSKVSYCMMDSIRYYPNAPAARYGGCNDTLQGITRFWGDVYGSTLDGQSLSIDGLASGTYYIITIYDPLNKFVDTNRRDDVAWTKIGLDMTGFRVTVQGTSG